MSRRGTLLAFAVGMGITLAYGIGAGGFAAPSYQEGFRVWSDAAFIAGVALAGVGSLAFVASDGLFDMLKFGLGKLLRVPLSKERRDAYPKTFFDYRLSKGESEKTGGGLILAGLAFLALGGAFLGLYLKG